MLRQKGSNPLFFLQITFLMLVDGCRDFDYLQMEANLNWVRTDFHNGLIAGRHKANKHQITALSTS